MPELASYGADVDPTPAAAPRTRTQRLASRLRPDVAGVPAAVWVISACYLGLLMCYSLLYPIYLGFDEPQHVDMTIALRHDPLSWPDPGERLLAQSVATSHSIVYGRARDQHVPPGSTKPRLDGPYLAAEAPPRSARQTIQALGDNSPTATPPALPNQMVQHPPLYYAIGAAVLGVLPFSESLAYDQLVGIPVSYTHLTLPTKRIV